MSYLLAKIAFKSPALLGKAYTGVWSVADAVSGGRAVPGRLRSIYFIYHEAAGKGVRVRIKGSGLYIGQRFVPSSEHLARDFLKAGILDLSISEGVSFEEIAEFSKTKKATRNIKINIQISSAVVELIKKGRWEGDSLMILMSAWADFGVKEVHLPNGVVFNNLFVTTEPSVVVVPITGEGKIVLQRQYRPLTDEKWSWEIPAGNVEKGESFELSAARELGEEMGLKAGEIKFHVLVYSTNALSNQKYCICVARELRSVPRRVDVEELISESKEVTPREAVEMIKSGQITDAATIMGILFCSQVEGER